MRPGRLSWPAAFVLLVVGWAFAHAVKDRPRPRTSRSGERIPKLPRSGTGTPSPPPSSSGVRESPAGRGDPAFATAAQCTALVGAGQRLPRAPGKVRFASWNLHWFPDGGPGRGPRGVDVNWLGCALAYLDADVIAVQEVKESAKADAALSKLLAELNRASGGRYVARIDDCGRRVTQHVGLIWNEARVVGSDVQTVGALNPLGSACEGQLRPGLGARFRSPGGLDLAVVSAHFKSKADPRAFELRRKSFAAVPGVWRELTAGALDDDFLLLGDLNTMGCADCAPPVAARDELAAADAELLVAGMRLVPADAAGTELYGGRLAPLDHALVATSMRELPPDARSHVAGLCAGGGGARHGQRAPARALSDHCPFVLDLTDRDLD